MLMQLEQRETLEIGALIVVANLPAIVREVDGKGNTVEGPLKLGCRPVRHARLQ